MQFYEFQVTWWNIALLIILAIAPAYLITLYSRSKRSPTKARIIKIAYDDGLLIERRLRPLYFRLSRKMIQSVSWLTQTAQSTLLRNKRSRGDGLRSIFSKAQSGSASDLLQGLSEADLAELRAPGLSDDQRVVLKALHDSGIFEGSDVSLLTEICSLAEVVKVDKGGYVFECCSMASDYLYVLKSGSCEALFKGDPNSKEMQSVCDVKGECIVASHVDIIAWITGASITRQLSLRCTSDCVLVRVPCPGRDDSNMRVHAAAYARIVRMLLNKINRATVGTALFHLGLADCMLPNHRLIKVSESVQELCGKVKTAGELNAALAGTSAPLYQLLRTSVIDVLGTEVEIDPSVAVLEVEMSVPASSSTSPATHTDTSSADTNLFTPPRTSASSQSRHAEVLSTDSKIAPPKALRGESSFIMSSMDTDALLAPISLKRSQSFDSTFSGGTGPLNKFSSPSSDFRDLARSRGTAKRLHVQVLGLKKGQNILEVDEVAGLYVVLSGAVRISYSGKFGDHVLGLWHKDSKVSLATPGSIIGHVTLISGTSEEWYGRRDSTASVLMAAVGDAEMTWLLHIPANGGQLIDAMSSTSAIFHVATDFITSLPPVLRLFDFCTKWRKVDGGDTVVVKGQKTMGEVLVVLSGRLGVLATKNEAKQSYAWSTPGPKVTGSFASRVKVEDSDNGPEYEYVMGKGAFIGEVELLTGECCKHTVRALRHTSLASVPFSLINYLSQWYPSILVHIARNVSGKQKDLASTQSGDSGMSRRSQAIMVVPISGSVPFDLVCSTLKFCLGNYVDKVTFLTSSDAADAFGSSFHTMSENEVLLTVGSWLYEIEFDSDIVIYQADWHSSAWNTLIASLCDEVVLVANALDDDPEVKLCCSIFYFKYIDVAFMLG
jgi:CRP-like cAMP-binding protein